MPPLLIFSFCSLLLDSFLDLESASAVLNSRIPLVRSEQGYQKKRAYQGDLGSPLSKMTLSPIILTSTDPLALSESDLIAFERALTGQIHVILVILLLVK